MIFSSQAEYRPTLSLGKIYLYSTTVVFSCYLLTGIQLAEAISGILSLGYPLLLCAIAVTLIKFFNPTSPLLAYPLFFSITLTAYLGVTKTLTGSHAASTSAVVFGLSFYSAFLAYKIFRKELSWRDTFIAANPLLLFTGPITTSFHYSPSMTMSRRFSQYFPYLITGIFFFKIIAAPLARFYPLIASTNFFTALFFAAIFELFVYFNFAGLSLIIYAIFGILGVRVPLNFRQPFSSRNVIEFWRGWHVSLSQVLKELFYRPVRKRSSASLALLAVFISSALWHGVTLNFFIWGVFHAGCFITTLALLKRGHVRIATVLMPFGVVVGRMIFAESSFERLLLKLSLDFSGPAFAIGYISKNSYLSLALGGAIVSAEFVFAKGKFFKQRTYKFLRLPLCQLLMLFLIVVLVRSSSVINYAVYGQR